MFSSVNDPVVSRPNESSWRVINNSIFDGKPDDAFRSTSLHLSFTNWERSVEEHGADGIQDMQLIRMQSVISIREAGRWIGDVDIIEALRDDKVSKLRPQTTCTHQPDERPDTRMTSVESWDELRDCQTGNVVVRAHGNWVARLAIASFLSQGVLRGDFQIDNIIVCPERVCWKCTEIYPASVYIF